MSSESLTNTDFQITSGEFRTQALELLKTLVMRFQMANYSVLDSEITTGAKTPLHVEVHGEYGAVKVILEIDRDSEAAEEFSIRVQFVAPSNGNNDRCSHRSTWEFTDIENALQQIERIAEDYDSQDDVPVWTVGQDSLCPSG